MSHENIILDLDAIKERFELYRSAFPLEEPNNFFEFDSTLTAEQNLVNLSDVALSDRFSLKYLFLYKQIILEVISRWISNSDKCKAVAVLDVTARFITSYPIARPLIEQFLETQNEYFTTILQNAPSQDAEQLRTILLAHYRLLYHSKDVFAKYIKPNVLYQIIYSESVGNVIKLLAVKILSIYLDSGERTLIDLIKTHIEYPDVIMGPYEMSKKTNYKFLELNEAKIASSFSELPELGETFTTSPDRKYFIINPKDLSANVVSICGILVPKAGTLSDTRPHELNFVPTQKAIATLRQLARGIRNSEPMLLIGKAGSGKTYLINELTKYLRCCDSMVKIHLGEQTDAKLLIGTYTSGEKPGTFVWRSGVLTTAVKEGRCVLIEDVDKAPTEVLSILLTLLERRELTVPSRGETIKAANGFQIISTVRLSENMKDSDEKNAALNLLGMRLWNTTLLEEPEEKDLNKILSHRFPVLLHLVPKLIQTYKSVKEIYLDSRFTSLNRGAHSRVVSVRDLVKLCSRLQLLFANNKITESDQLIESQVYDNIFAEAADCFAGAISEKKALEPLINCIGESLEISNSRIALYLRKHVPDFEEDQNQIKIGRSTLKKSQLCLQKKSVNSTSFATTNHSLRLMEQIAVSIQMCEPVLLVGETGTGKTTVVQQLGKLMHKPLTVINVSQQTETGDLLGGYKPVNSKSIALPIQETFESLFSATFSLKKNEHFYKMLHKCFNKSQWRNVVRLWTEACKMAHNILDITDSSGEGNDRKMKKKRKLNLHERKLLVDKWVEFENIIHKFEAQSSSIEGSFVFDFVEGSLVKAVRNGDWLLLDEINLASADTLESISDLLAEKDSRSILLSEKGEAEPVKAHPDFRIFACMNPATDVGKRDLPSGIRSRFTEIYVHSPDRDISDLLSIIDKYIHNYSVSDEWVGNDIAELYLEAKKLAEANKIVDGSNEKPHFSIRTLTRTLLYVCDIIHIYGLRRSLYDGFCMSFLTLLSQSSEALLEPIIRKYTLGRLKNIKSVMSQAPQSPGPDYVQFKHYWMKKGTEEIRGQPHYIITPFVEKNLLNLVRASSSKRFPVLVQGPTSAGKTSMIKYLADLTGHKFVRINNHEHTDLQEYLGTYITDDTGKLTFKEGVLVEALRKGYWIVLDELNLAPTDVLEALNRLLDDNRELFIPETQQTVHPHPDFMLFATQNPPGIYGGRKILSRAFRNRFLELHFDDIPRDELEIILRERCQIAPSYAKKIVEAYRQLSVERSSSRLFEQKNSFATLRDLFRWALRDAVGYEQLAANGYMLLAERCRTLQEKDVVKKTLEKVMRVQLNMDQYYGELENTSLMSEESSVVWTQALRRLSVLVSTCLQNNEPVLLVGETGCGKTTICQLLASFMGKHLITLNAHQNTETGDLLGAQRPLRNRSALQAQLIQVLCEVLNITSDEAAERSLDNMLKMYDELDHSGIDNGRQTLIKDLRDNLKTLFEWSDGPLVQALRQGDFFLLDEISLADDSVLERLNSVLEPERSLLLAEKGGSDCLVDAADGFQFFATMNPGGDYGKKELSPALRNRFTEIWVSSMENFEDVRLIVSCKLIPPLKHLGASIVSFSEWFALKFGSGNASNGVISLRDILAWIEFMNVTFPSVNEDLAVLAHGASMVFIDALGTNNTAYLAESEDGLNELKNHCIGKLSEFAGHDISEYFTKPTSIEVLENTLFVGPFKLSMKHGEHAALTFNWKAPTTALNLMRVARALQVHKPILLEGSPGVGKTSLVTALAEITGNSLTRINLSEQTDLIDLFGSDVPGANTGEFVWRDAPFLRAMQRGEWVLLDEMNLASQSVLEGLNACLDHRGQAYIPELDKSFTRHPNFVVFAAQNPQYQGGGRKGLPKSFVNRFSVVYINTLSSEDLLIIANQLFPNISQETSTKMIQLMSALEDQVCKKRLWGAQGSPWEFNLRDTLRWMTLLSENSLSEDIQVFDFLDMIVIQRFRNDTDREKAENLIHDIFGVMEKRDDFYKIATDYVQINGEVVKRNDSYHYPTVENLLPLQCNFSIYESALRCIRNKWPVILVGPSNSGKTDIVRFLASIIGAEVTVFSMNSDVDSMDILGGYEQVDLTRKISYITNNLRNFLRAFLLNNMGKKAQNKGKISAGLELLRFVSEVVTTPERFNLFKQKFEVFRSQLEEPSELQETTQKIDEISKIMDNGNAVKFEWFDGILVRAVEEGHWLILDNANLCSPSVLDRLNSLLETNGSLTINECSQADGQPRDVRPHPNFRLFLTVNPKYGELSRAMRNRGVEIFVDDLHARASSFDRLMLGLDTRSIMQEDPEMQEGLKKLSLYDKKRSLPLKRFIPPYLSFVVVFAQIHDILNRYENCAQEDTLLSVMPIDQLSDLKIWSGEILNSRIFADGMIAERLSNYYDFLMNLGVVEKISSLYTPVQKRLSVVLQHPCGNSNTQVFLPALNVYELSTINKHIPDIQTESIYLMSSLRILLKCVTDLEYTKAKSTGGKIGDLSYIELSAAVVSGRNIKNPPRIPIYKVLKSFLELLLQKIMNGELFQKHKLYNLVWNLLIIWIGTFETSSRKDEARLTVYKDLFEQCYSLAVAEGINLDGFSDILTDFHSSVALTRGHSINVLWSAFRKNYPSSAESWALWNELLTISRRFDDIVKLQFSDSYQEVRSLRDTFTSVFSDVLYCNIEDSKVFTASLSQGIQKLEDISAKFLVKRKHIFSEEFDHIIRFLLNQENVNAEAISGLASLSSLSTEQIFKIQTGAYCYAPIFDSLWVKTDGLFESYTKTIFTSSLFEGIIPKVNSMKNFPGSHMRQTLSDAKVLLSSVVKLSSSVLSDSLSLSADRLLQWLNRVIEAHTDTDITSFEEEEIVKCILEQGNGFFSSVFEQYLLPSIQLSRNCISVEDLGRAWVLFGAGLILLYAPDHPYDPAIHDYVLYDHFLKHQEFSRQLRDSWVTVRQVTSGDRSILVERIISSTSQIATPQKPRVYRPGSAIDDVFDEWTALYNSTLNVNHAVDLMNSITSWDKMSTNRLTMFQQNTSQFLDRLRIGYEYFSDLNDIFAGYIFSMKFGFDLLEYGRSQTRSDISSSSLWAIDPLTVICSPRIDKTFQKLIEFFKKCNVETLSVEKVLIFYLKLCKSHRSSLNDALTFNGVLQTLYYRWSLREYKSESKVREQSTIFRYQDDSENYEADFKRMFPDYEDVLSLSMTEGKNMEVELESIYSLIAKAYVAIFETAEDESIEEMLQGGSEVVQILLEMKGPLEEHPLLGPHLTSIVNRLADEISSFEVQSETVDFYNGYSIAESQKAIVIIESLWKSVSELVVQWPEHATLKELFRICEEFLGYPASTPIAKQLQKVEQIYTFVAEWEKYASSQVSLKAHVKTITDLIISWRRLELQTWSDLLRAEEAKLESNIGKWWFHLFETIIISTNSDSDKRKSTTLLASLNIFFSKSTLGEFGPRLKLLGSFAKHIALLGLSESDNAHAINNIIAFYGQFQPLVDSHISSERKILEKELKDVILLASWKDVNVEALKQSSRRSHGSLYKLVRKYRAIISESVQPIVEGGIPSTERNTIRIHPLAVPKNNELDLSMAKKLVNEIPDWESRTGPLKNIDVVMRNMDHYCQQIGVMEFPNLTDLAKEFAAEAERLEKDTPKVYVKEQKKELASLKMQKSKALSDCLKELRRIGLKSSFREDIHKVQLTATSILANIVSFSDMAIAGCDSYFFRIIDILPRLRSAVTNPSESIPIAYIEKGMAIMENLIFSLITSRNPIQKLAASHSKFDQLRLDLEAVVDTQEDIKYQSMSFNHTKMQEFCRWLPLLVDYGLKTLQTTSDFGSVTEDIKFLNSVKEEAISFRQNVSEVDLWDSSSQKIYNSFESFVSNLLIVLKEKGSDTTFFVYDTIARWVEDNAFSPSREEINDGPLTDIEISLRKVFTSILLSFQKFLDGGVDSISSVDDEWFSTSSKRIVGNLKLLHHLTVVENMENAVKLLKQNDYVARNSVLIKALVTFTLPVIRAYQTTINSMLQKCRIFYDDMAHGSYIFSVILQNLARNGFCSPEPPSEEVDDNNLHEGTGLGDGEGAQSNSKDVEQDEDLTENAQKENKEQDDQNDDKEEDDAVSMEGDMAGELENISGQEEDDEEIDEQENDDMDEQVDDIDDEDPNAIDDKMWDEQPDKDVKEKNSEANLQNKDEDPDVQAAENENQEADAGENEGQDEEKMDNGPDADDNDIDGDDGSSEDESEENVGEQEDEVRDEKGDDLASNVPEIETLDLPEDLNLDSGHEDDAEDDEDEDDRNMSESGEPEDSMEEDAAVDSKESQVEEMDENDINMEDDMDQNQSDLEDEGENMGPDPKEESPNDSGEGSVSDEEDLLEGQQPDPEKGQDGADDNNEGLDGVEDTVENDAVDPEAAAQQQSGSRGAGSDSKDSAEREDVGSSGDTQNAHQENETDQTDNNEGSREDVKETLRQLGDSLREYHKRRQEINDASQVENEETLNEKANERPDEFEHLDGANTESNTQALGLANQDQIQSIDEEKAIEDDLSEQEKADECDIDMLKDENLEGEEVAESLPLDIEKNSGDKDEEKSRGAFIGERKERVDHDVTLSDALEMNKNDELDELMDKIDSETLHENEETKPARSIEESRALWHESEMSTTELSARLSEQLRLILEPTLATKLRGDYKTGKRLNMKRIIPYIASQFRKDKIWLRRTKPSKRQYQIMVALDDSKSMSESKCVKLAFDSLCLVSKTLTQLESGGLSIVKFGETIREVHSFDQQFSNEAGAKSFQCFGFQETKTDIKKLVAESIKIFERARSFTSGDQWQLEIIISDGLCEDHDTVQRLVRRARENKIMLVFVIIDGINNNESIMDMSQVKYIPDQFGNMQLNIDKYLDTFPFDFYVVVHDISELPEMLSTILRQFFTDLASS